MNSYQLIYPMFAHVVLSSLLYVALTIMRAPAIWKIGCRADGSNPWSQFEPRVSANLSNQFEWPVLFYVVCLLILITEKQIGDTYIVLAWLFIAGRMLHSLVQILTSNIRLRGMIFTINFLAVLAMWFLLCFKNI